MNEDKDIKKILSSGKEVLSDFFDEEYFDGGRKNKKSNYVNSHWKYDRNKVVIDVKVIKKYFDPKVVLDIGCAKGYLVNELRKNEIESYGIDVSEYILSKVDKEVKDFVFQYDVKELPDEWDSKFDFVTIFHVLEHIPEKLIYSTIMEISKVIKINGFLCMEVPMWRFKNDRDVSHILLRDFDFWKEKFEETKKFKHIPMKLMWRSFHPYSKYMSGWKIFKRINGE